MQLLTRLDSEVYLGEQVLHGNPVPSFRFTSQFFPLSPYKLA